MRLVQCWMLALWLGQASPLPIERFYQFGVTLDTSLPSGDEVSSPEIRLRQPIKFFGEHYDTIYVNGNGLISFSSELTEFISAQFPLQYPVIAPLYSNVDTTSSGKIFYRESTDVIELEEATDKIRTFYPNLGQQFVARSLFIVTWDRVGYFHQGYDKMNTFQVAISSDGEESFVEFLYLDGGIQWIQGSKDPRFMDSRAQAGIVGPNGRLYTLRGSGTDQVKNLDKWTNTELPGMYMFRVGRIPESSNVEPPQTALYDEHETQEPTTCTDGSIYCHSKADCYDSERGFCCKCQYGYYGNGRNCFKEGIPLRVNGKLNISVNGIEAQKLDLQAYVITADGKSYTAVSGVPKTIGHELQLAESLGSVIAWLFARPITEAKNGYQLTGGVFNHTVELVFDTRHRVEIKQRYLGLDVYDQIKMEAEIIGSLPYVPQGKPLKMPDFQEQFIKESPGVFRSAARHELHSEQTNDNYIFLKNQIIQFKEHCPEANSDLNALRLKSARIIITFDSNEGILRFTSTNKISKNAEGEDPCVEGQAKCVANSTCLVEGDNFRCICNRGFDSVYGEDGRNDFGCVDINECSDGTANCNENAICVNEIGSYNCRCRPGYEGDGIICRAPGSPCDRNPDLCNLQNGICTIPGDINSCICNQGYYKVAANVQLGFVCGDIDECLSPETCSPNAQCYNLEGSFDCKCKPGYDGDGFTYCEESICINGVCPEGVDCMRNETGRVHCVCRPPYTGDPPVCVIPPRAPNIRLCSRDHECSTFGRCLYNSSIQGYTCACVPNYNGDGYVCYPNFSEYTEKIVRTCLGGNCWCPTGYHDNGDYCVKNESEEPSKIETAPCNIENTCHRNAQCLFASKQFQCICNPGYEGDGHRCAETGFSCEFADVCDEHALCKYDETTERHICICENGYQGDGTNCFLSGDCINNSECTSNAECVYNSEKDYNECICRPGFTKLDGECKPVEDCEWCHPDAECLKDEETSQPYCRCRPGLVGDGINGCEREDGCNVLNNCSPYASCINDGNHFSWRCICNAAFEGDGYVCNPIRSCINLPDLCSQDASCIQIHDEYQCKCNEGFAGNGTFCREVKRQDKEFLLLNQGRSTLQIPFHQTKYNKGRPIHIHQGQTAIGIAIDCVEGRVYWSDISHQTIKSSKYDGNDIQDFITEYIDSPEGLAVDWMNRNIYWTDSGLDTINVANLDSKESKVIISDGLVNPRGIAVHPWRRKVFWSDWNREAPKLEWSNFDGSGRDILLQGSSVKLPNSLAIDWSRDELCWADAGTETIECLTLSNLSRRTAVPKCRYPFGLAITSDKYYWTDWITHKIETALKSSGEILNPLELPLGGDNKLYGLTAVTATCPN